MPSKRSSWLGERSTVDCYEFESDLVARMHGFPKKVYSHAHAASFHFAVCNPCRPHQTFTKAAKVKTTPAMAAGIETYPLPIGQLCELLDS